MYERFVNRFFEDESELAVPISHASECTLLIPFVEVFVDVQGDKYLARIVKTFPPRSLATSPLRNRASDLPVLKYHTLGANLSLEAEDVLEQDDPMKYFYSARLIVEGAGGESAANGDASGEEFEGSVMEVQADKIRYVHGHV